MAAVHNLTATVLIQVGADEPKPIGTIEIPINFSTGSDQQEGGGPINVYGISGIMPCKSDAA